MRQSLGPAFVAAALAAAALVARGRDGGGAVRRGLDGVLLAPDDFFIGMQDDPGANALRLRRRALLQQGALRLQHAGHDLRRAQPERPREAVDAVEPRASIEVWIGDSCNDINLRGARCHCFGSTLMSGVLPRRGGPPLHSDRRADDERTAEPGRRHDARRRPQRHRILPTRTARSTASSSPRPSGCSSTRTTTACPTSRRRRRPHRSHAAAAARSRDGIGRGRKPGADHQLAGRRHRPLSPTCSATRCCATAAATLQVFSDGTLRPRVPELRPRPTRWTAASRA